MTRCFALMLAILTSSTALAQANRLPRPTRDVRLIGRWDITITTPQGTAPSWIEISADGEKVFGGMMTAGESRTFEARKTFRLTLGNAGGVRVSVDGRPLAPLGRSGQVVRDVVIPDSPSRG